MNDLHNVPIDNSSFLRVKCGKTAKTSQSLFLSLSHYYEPAKSEGDGIFITRCILLWK